MTFDAGFMIAESAEIGRRLGFPGSAMSTMTTCAVSPTFSRTQINLSDSIVSVEKPMLAALIPTFWSYAWKEVVPSKKAFGAQKGETNSGRHG